MTRNSTSSDSVVTIKTSNRSHRRPQRAHSKNGKVRKRARKNRTVERDIECSPFSVSLTRSRLRAIRVTGAVTLQSSRSHSMMDGCALFDGMCGSTNGRRDDSSSSSCGGGSSSSGGRGSSSTGGGGLSSSGGGGLNSIGNLDSNNAVDELTNLSTKSHDDSNVAVSGDASTTGKPMSSVEILAHTSDVVDSNIGSQSILDDLVRTENARKTNRGENPPTFVRHIWSMAGAFTFTWMFVGYFFLTGGKGRANEIKTIMEQQGKILEILEQQGNEQGNILEQQGKILEILELQGKERANEFKTVLEHQETKRMNHLNDLKARVEEQAAVCWYPNVDDFLWE